MKKIIASLSVVTLLAMNVLSSTVSAAGLNGNTLTASENVNDFVIDSSATPFSGSATCTATVNGVTKVCTKTDANTLTIANGGAIAANTSYQIAFVTDDNAYASVVYNNGTANKVAVTARVLPTLTLSVANPTVDLGALSVAGAVSSATDPAATVTTNAVNGLTLTVASANHGLTSANAAHTIAAAATGAGTEGYALTVSETADPQNNGSVVASPVITGGAVTAATVTGPTLGYVATVDVAASISSLTPAAGDYSDTLTFSVTGSF